MFSSLLQPGLVTDKRLLRRQAYTVVGLGLFINVLILVQPVFMLHVYDFVLPSQSRATLVLLTLIALFVVAASTLVDYLRSRLLIDMARGLDTQVRERAFRGAFAQGAPGSALAQSLETVRNFISGPAPAALMDLPWTPFFILALFLLSPWLGALSLGAAGAALFLGWSNERSMNRQMGRATAAARSSVQLADDALQALPASRAMGFGERLLERWSLVSGFAAQLADRAAIGNAGYAAGVRGLRLGLQILSLAVAAWLVLEQKLSPGSIIAASLLGGRALGPVDSAISNWKRFVSMRLALTSVQEMVEAGDRAARARTKLPPPIGQVTVEGLTVVTPEGVPLLRDISFTAPAGKLIGVVGRSGSGKSTLLKVLSGALAPTRGRVRLDGSDLDHWPEEDLGRHVGYVPQDCALHLGTVAENIRRFGPVDDDKTVEAAVLSGAHAAVQSMPDGYETEIATGGDGLSGGERQRIAIARAFYDSPAVIFLDEPAAHLDGDAEDQLMHAVLSLRDQGKTVFLVTHKPSHLRSADIVMVMDGGRVRRMGPAQEVLRSLLAPVAKAS